MNNYGESLLHASNAASRFHNDCLSDLPYPYEILNPARKHSQNTCLKFQQIPKEGNCLYS